MQEIRDIVAARLNRRELARLGLVAGGVVAPALGRGFRPFWAHAAAFRAMLSDGGGGGDGLISPPNTPFADPLPIPSVVRPAVLDPAPTINPNPVPSALTRFTEAPRPNHQRWTEFGGASNDNNVAGFTGPEYEVVERALLHDFYPQVDGVPPSTIWTYVDANASTAPQAPLVFESNYGDPTVVRVHNALPVANEGFGINQTSVHRHGGFQASESDGGPLQFFDAGQFKDFHYAHVRPGFSRNIPTSSLNGVTVPGDVLGTASTYWYHDHRVDFTAQNTYKGLVGFYTLFSKDIDLDTGDETTGLRLPSGEFDVPLVFADKVFDPTTGQLFFDLFNLDGILGDKYTVNGKIQPFLDVKRRKYRFRLLDGGPSRTYEFFLSDGSPFIQITNDGNLLPRPLVRRSIRIAPAERVDVIVDFSQAKSDVVYLQNRLEQEDGRGPTGKIVAPANVLQFRVGGAVADPSRVPATLLALPPVLPPVRKRVFQFDRSGGQWTVNGRPFDPEVISAIVRQNTAEQWTFGGTGGWQHPIHVHLEDLQIASRDGKAPPADEIARKDVVRIGEAAVGTDDIGETVVNVLFRDWLGDYPVHCHNTVHEDHAMMIRFQIVE